MTGPAAPHGMTSTLPPLSGLVAGFAVLVVAVIFITHNARAHHVEPSGWGPNGPPGRSRQRARPALRRLQAHPQSRNGQPADPSAGAPAPADDSRERVSRL